MARKNYAIGHLIHIDPADAKKQLLDMLREEKMHMSNVAKRIGCTPGTLINWFNALAMKDEVDEMRATARREGWHFDISGRPKAFGDDDDRARKKILAALKENGMNLSITAEKLGIATKTLENNIASLGLRDRVDGMRDKAQREGTFKRRERTEAPEQRRCSVCNKVGHTRRQHEGAKKRPSRKAA